MNKELEQAAEKKGAQLIQLERKRQIEQEGWSHWHDDRHNRGQLKKAADCYFNFADSNNYGDLLTKPKKWPWAKAAWKPKNQKQDYIRAGALYQAEIDRLQRLCLNDAALYMQARLSQIECEIRINSINK